MREVSERPIEFLCWLSRSKPKDIGHIYGNAWTLLAGRSIVAVSCQLTAITEIGKGIPHEGILLQRRSEAASGCLQVTIRSV